MLPDETVEACLDTVMKQVRTLHQIAGEFSAYAKLPALALEPTDPAAFMRTTVGPYQAARPPHLIIEERFEPTGRVAIDARVLSRAVVNLVENALHAMPEGGKLTLGVRPDEDNRQVVLSVEDSGTGLDPEVRRHLFDPYFSTKSSGTGLGLAIARRAVEAHHGTIDVQSEPGRGTVFHIRLPLID
jgi:signal transduction histidine kinase